jgi:hypothetical protein
MKIRFGLIYLVLIIVAEGYELYKNHFTEFAVVNYLLTGFLYASVAFIIVYIVVKVAMSLAGRVRHREVQTAK